MYLQKLEIQGFKSFAHQIELVFNRELTAIVGPNGSGKSNIADSVRWVLGEQSVKLLRGKKSDDVIFSGSDKKARLSFAQVDLHLDNSDHQAPVDYDQIVISRKIYRDGESEYLLNNTKVRLSDIQILLAKSHFGQKTYSVIGQGTVDHLLTLSSAERKDFFDEATGVKQYQIKKDQSVNKLLATHENLIQAENILTEITPRLRSLSRQVRRLELKEENEKKLQDLQTQYYSFLSQTLQTELNKVQGEKKQQESKVAKVKTELDKVGSQLEQQSVGPSRNQEFDLLQKKLTTLQDEYNLLSREKTRLEGSRDLDLMKSGKQDLVWLQARLDTVNNKVSKLQIEVEEHSRTLTTKKKLTQDLGQKISALDLQIKQIEKQMRENLEPHADWDKLAAAASKLESDQVELDELIQLAADDSGWQQVKKTWLNFGQSLKTFWQTFRKPSPANQTKLLEEFQKLLAEKDVLQRQLQTEKLAEQSSEQQVVSLKQQLQELEQEKIKINEQMTDAGGRSSTVNASQLQELASKLTKQAQAIAEITKQIGNFNQLEEGKKQQILEWQKSFSRAQYDYNLLGQDLNKYNIELAKLETREEDLQREIREEFPQFQATKVSSLNSEEVRDKINDLKKQLAVIGSIDEATMSEYTEVKERHTFLTQQTADLKQATASLQKLIKELDETIAKQFNDNFVHINTYFNKYFKKLFSGGTAKLILEMKQPEEEDLGTGDSEPVGTSSTTSPKSQVPSPDKSRELKFQSLEYGIEIQATPPGKRLSGIAMLSGGEKALTAIALISAIIANNPSPFVVLDEVDAALDEANSVRFAEIIDELSDKTQFIAITHNRATMQQAKILYGVTMGDDGISRLLSVNFSEADKIAA
ncbi:MAG: AAA family ATPase [Candidatus Komeilibacteria bacterium]